MNAQELRIGNLVRSKDWKPNNGAGEFNYTPEFFEIDGRHLSDFEYFKNLMEPIPLTEEWLIRFGFEKQEYVEGIRYSKQIADWAYLQLWVDRGVATISETVEINDHDIGAPCQHVHQLQNVIFALTGKEIE